LVLIVLYHLTISKFSDKSGWVPPLLGLAATVGFRSWRAGLVLVVVGALAGSSLVPQLLGTDEYSLSTRLDAWLIVGQLVQASPLWGLGFANYYWYTPLLPIRGYAVSFNSHNNYVDLVAQTGVVGLACFLWFLWEVGRLTWRLRERVPDGFARAYVLGAWGGLVGTVVAGMLGDWILPFFYNIGLQGFRSSMLAWLFLGGLVSLEQVGRSERSTE
jgi:O-antigen ligase